MPRLPELAQVRADHDHRTRDLDKLYGRGQIKVACLRSRACYAEPAAMPNGAIIPLVYFSGPGFSRLRLQHAETQPWRSFHKAARLVKSCRPCHLPDLVVGKTGGRSIRGTLQVGMGPEDGIIWLYGSTDLEVLEFTHWASKTSSR